MMDFDAIDEVVNKYLDPDGFGLPHEWGDVLDVVDDEHKEDSLRILVQHVVASYVNVSEATDE